MSILPLEKVKDLFEAYKQGGCGISLKVYFLHSHSGGWYIGATGAWLH